MVYLSTIENSVARRYLSYEDPASAKKKLHRRFVKMIENCGGSIEHLKEGNKNISFPEEEKDFIQMILEQLAKEEGLSFKIWENRDDTFDLGEVHAFIQDYADYLGEHGYDEGTILGVVKELDMLFQLSVRQTIQRCHELLDCYALNLKPYLYTYQNTYAAKMERVLMKILASTMVEAAIHCSDLGSFIKDAMELTESDSISDLYGEEDDVVKDEYVQRDKAVIQFLNENPEFKLVVEKKTGATIESIWRLTEDDGEKRFSDEDTETESTLC